MVDSPQVPGPPRPGPRGAVAGLPAQAHGAAPRARALRERGPRAEAARRLRAAGGAQEKAARGDTVMATSTRLFQGRVVEDSERKKGESLLASTPVVVLSAILGRIPTLDEYESAVQGINLTKFAPPLNAMSN